MPGGRNPAHSLRCAKDPPAPLRCVSSTPISIYDSTVHPSPAAGKESAGLAALRAGGRRHGAAQLELNRREAIRYLELLAHERCDPRVFPSGQNRFAARRTAHDSNDEETQAGRRRRDPPIFARRNLRLPTCNWPKKKLRIRNALPQGYTDHCACELRQPCDHESGGRASEKTPRSEFGTGLQRQARRADWRRLRHRIPSWTASRLQSPRKASRLLESHSGGCSELPQGCICAEAAP